MKEFNTVTIGFFEYLKGIKKMKDSSIRDVKCTLKKLHFYIDENSMRQEVWELELEDYIQYINFLRERNEKGSGISKQISHLRSYIDYCWKLGYGNKNPLYGYEVQDHSPQYVSRVLNTEEMTKLLSCTLKKTKQDRQERLIILVLYGLGLRTSELSNLKGKDISIENQDVYVKGKFDIERRVPIPDGVWIELLAYLHENPSKKTTLFTTQFKKKKLGVADVGNVVKKYAGLAGLDGIITPKVLRHTFATHLMDQGIDISIISSLMGHKSPRETGIYLHAFDKNKIHAVKTMEPIFSEGV